MAAETAYDAVAYPSFAFAQTHPNRLATIATLFGMAPAPVDRCRVLELGCGEGGNLIPMAFGLPNSTFVGVDLAPTAIATAVADAKSLGLANVEFHCADLLDWVPPGGPFDYIVAHGLFSWVPEPVRLRVLDLYGHRLAANGVGYVSYNALPGCHIRGMLRDMLLFHTRHFDASAQKIAQAKGMMKLLIAAQQRETEYGTLLKREAEWMLSNKGDSVLFHDDLAEVNQPYYFHQFMALSQSRGLRYLGEADFFEMQDGMYPPPVVASLRQFSGDIVLKEQYLDFLKCRRFRQTLLCRQDVPLNRDVKSSQVRRFRIASQAKPESADPNLAVGAAEAFTGPRESKMQVDHPLTKAAMLELLAVWPRSLPFDELVSVSRARLSAPENDADVQELADTLLSAYAAGLVELHLFEASWAAIPGERPNLSRLARLQLTQGRDSLTSLRHTRVQIDGPITRDLLLMLDGTRDRPALLAEVSRRLNAGELTLPAGLSHAKLPPEIDRILAETAAGPLLTA